MRSSCTEIRADLASLDTLTSRQITECLNRRPEGPTSSPFPPNAPQTLPRQAAVLVPLVQIDRAWRLLFIRRAECAGDRHSGQVAFVGGKREPGDDDAEATALREAAEELGIDPGDVQVLGRLNDQISVTNYAVRPVVGTMPWPYELAPAPLEVARYFTVPLSWLADFNNRELRYRELAPGAAPVPVIYFRKYDGETLWGTTARITVSLIDLLVIPS